MRPPSAAIPPPKPSWSFSVGGVEEACQTGLPPATLKALIFPAASSV